MEVIKATSIGIRYKDPKKNVKGMLDKLLQIFLPSRDESDFWALKEINFSVQKGEVVGVIGRNGSGKTTLLKTIAKVIPPTQGKIKVNGKVFPLLELGVGFLPDLTGRENCYLTSSLFGLSKRGMDEIIDEIIEFAELKEFIDWPLKTYSSGMVARLGFALGTSIRAEILLIDEIISIGDEKFQKKSLQRMEQFLSHGHTVMIVSHDMGIIERYCNRVLLLGNGRLIFDGEVDLGIKKYRELM